MILTILKISTVYSIILQYIIDVYCDYSISDWP